MSSKILAITLLLLSVCLCFQFSEGNRRHATRRVSPPCCVKVSTANIINTVVGDTYRKQSADAPCVEAIILTTQDGLACVDPNAQWVQDFISDKTSK